MPMKLDQAMVVITGASRGIGQATAEAFARLGSHLVLASRNACALEAVAENGRRLSGRADWYVTDVTDPSAVDSLAKKAASLGNIDVWGSNAGIGAGGRFEETPLKAHQQIIRTNFIGYINDAYAAVPIFLSQGRGIFVNMISLGGFAAGPFATAYIHICDVYPAFVDTPGLNTRPATWGAD